MNQEDPKTERQKDWKTERQKEKETKFEKKTINRTQMASKHISMD